MAIKTGKSLKIWSIKNYSRNYCHFKILKSNIFRLDGSQ